MTRVRTLTRGPSGGWGFGDLRQEMDALFDRFGTAPGAGSGVYPAVNLYETGDAYVLSAELPGVPADGVEVCVEGASVTLSGERRLEAPEGASQHRRERQSGSFRRAFELPVRIDAEKVEAVHRNGVLMVQLPKAPEHQPRQIRVQAS